ncbi:protein PML-like [Ochotona princeps]|uniref:protein PML-like n=1 Tax=Ochotona princeps TaxID=9978 RepID=UPI002714DEF2|nr:protein PML-like [Ochotona princeps]
MDKLDAFQKATSGFLAFLPLIRGLVPNATSYLLNSLAETYLGRSISEGSALEAVLAMRDLCRHFQVRLGPRLTLNIFSVSSLQCFSSLQPLMQAAILSRRDAGLLALRKVGFQKLLSVHRDDPQQGLERYLSFLNPQLTSLSGPKLRALSAYFKNKFKGASALA